MEILIDSVAALCNRQLYQIGTEAIRRLKYEDAVSWHPNLALWPSIFSGIGIIVNRVTPAHRDRGACSPVYDLLASLGTHSNARLSLPDVHAQLSYKPGTIVLVCGRVLRHEVTSWEGGDRVCWAHYMRDNVHNRLELPRPDWVNIEAYNNLMESGFRARQGW